MNKLKAKAPTEVSERVLVQKWGKHAIADGFTALPNVLFRYAKALELTHTDLLVLLQLASYWWAPTQNPWPSKKKIAAALDMDPRTVQRSIARMEKLKYVKRIYRRAEVGDNLSNEYDLRGLARAVDAMALKVAKEREEREAADQQRKRTPKLFELVKGGKNEDM